MASIGDRVKMTDQVKVCGYLLEKPEQKVYIILNKPRGVTSTTDTTDKTNVVDYVNYPDRIFHIGRLDKDSEGLLLLTNDGDIVNKILREGNDHEKEYEVTVDKPVTPQFVEQMSRGVRILGTITKKCMVEQEGVNRFRIVLTQGMNRQIRRMCETLGYEVMQLKRVRVMHIKLGRLGLGEWRFLTSEEQRVLLRDLEHSTGEVDGSVQQNPRPKARRRGYPQTAPKNKQAADSQSSKSDGPSPRKNVTHSRNSKQSPRSSSANSRFRPSSSTPAKKSYAKKDVQSGRRRG